MFWRRYIAGFYPLLVWAADEDAADVVAVMHHAARVQDLLNAPDPLEIEIDE